MQEDARDEKAGEVADAWDQPYQPVEPDLEVRAGDLHGVVHERRQPGHVRGLTLL